MVVDCVDDEDDVVIEVGVEEEEDEGDAIDVDDIDVEAMDVEEVVTTLDEVVADLLEREIAAAPAITMMTIITTATRIRLIPDDAVPNFKVKK